MFSKFKKFFLVITSLAFVLLMTSFYFFGIVPTMLMLGLAAELTDRSADKHLGPRKESIFIDDKEFRMPEEYVVIATNAKGIYKDNVVFRLEYIWPDFVPKRLATSEEYAKAKDEQRLAHLWVQKARPEKMAEHLKLKANEGRIVKHEFVKKIEDFEEYQYFVKIHKTEDLKVIGSVYLLKSPDGAITDVVDCTNPYPPFDQRDCNYYFLDKGLLYALRFKAKPEPLTWLEWKKKNIEFIDQYRVN